jgi:D-beta-D-heptose 7-phosphate kinase / D-beta-D-heptose 1-phosphate adenosyltransferase
VKPLIVVGDTMLDVDLEGDANRLCPGAPVPVVDVATERLRPGGAGLAALLAARSTAEVVLVTALGDDDTGRALSALLDGKLHVVPMPLRGETVRKTRVRAGGQSLLRLDSGDGMATPGRLASRVCDALRSAGAILVADYGRGVAAHPALRQLLTELAPWTPVVWDPHPRGPAPIGGAWLITPNLSEARGFAAGYTEPAELAKILRDDWGADSVAVTTGESGAVLANGKRTVAVAVPAQARPLAVSAPDTCGAGDCFAAAAAAALLGGSPVTEAVTQAVSAAARFVAAGGASSLSVEDSPHRTPGSRFTLGPETPVFELAERVRARGGRLVATGGCFDLLHPGHISLLRRARELGDALVVCLNSDDSVRGLKGPHRPIMPARDRARLLSELASVDAVTVFDTLSPAALLERLRPDIWVKGGDYAGAALPESEVVRRHGGEVVLIPTVEGYSTSRLVAAMRPTG